MFIIKTHAHPRTHNATQFHQDLKLVNGNNTSDENRDYFPLILSHWVVPFLSSVQMVFQVAKGSFSSSLKWNSRLIITTAWRQKLTIYYTKPWESIKLLYWINESNFHEASSLRPQSTTILFLDILIIQCFPSFLILLYICPFFSFGERCIVYLFVRPGKWLLA